MILLVIKILTKEQKKRGMIVHCNRALQFCGGSPDIYQCSAGKTLLTILANGDLLPCRRLPIILGNIKDNSIYNIIKDNNIIDDLNNDFIPSGCEKCLKARTCRGGAKCLSYALTGDYHQKDINCIF